MLVGIVDDAMFIHIFNMSGSFSGCILTLGLHLWLLNTVIHAQAVMRAS